MPPAPAALELLERSRRAVDALSASAARAAASGDDERALSLVEGAARVACFAHGGRFAAPELERIAIEIGNRTSAEHADAAPDRRAAEGRRRVLHVATRLLPLGGHSRLLANWILNDTGSRHSVAVTAQGRQPIPSFIAEAVRAGGGDLTVLPAAGYAERSLALRRLAASSADTVLLHVHQFDPVPIAAFARAGGPPVALINHADHTFWLGSSIADAVVNIRRFGDELARRRRGVRRARIIPLPLRPPTPAAARAVARARLRLNAADVVLLTVGARYKYESDARHDFFATVGSILSATPGATLIVAGFTRAEIDHPSVVAAGERMRFVGPQPDLSPYFSAADLYLDGFPYSSFTALLEAGAAGLCPVLMHDPVPQLDVSDDPGLTAISHPVSRESYVRQVTALIADGAGRHALGARVAADIAAHHWGVRWTDGVERLHADLDRSGHDVVVPPVPSFAVESADIDRATWDSLSYGDYPLMALATPAFSGVAPLTRLLMRSIRSGDTRGRFRHVRAWLGAWRRCVLRGEL